MSKIISYYKEDLDKCWYNSSNVVYSECKDHDNALKEVNVVFKNGNEYVYHDVTVQDYLMFREDASQGKALNKFIKKYEFTRKEEKRDLELLKEELDSILVLASEATERKDGKDD